LGNTPLHYSSRLNNDQKLYWLIKHNADVNAKNKDGYTPLHVACQRGNIKIVKLLVQNGALVNMENNFLYTALHFASEKSIDGLVYFLLQNGAHPYATNVFGKTPLMRAIKFRYVGDIALLMEKPNTNFNNPHIITSCTDDETKEFVLHRARIHIFRRLRQQLKKEFGAIANDKRCYISFKIGLIQPKNLENKIIIQSKELMNYYYKKIKDKRKMTFLESNTNLQPLFQ